MGRAKEPTVERMLTVADAADLFSVHKRTIQREIERGNLLPAVMVSGETRLPISTLRQYISQRMIRPATKGAQP